MILFIHNINMILLLMIYKKLYKKNKKLICVIIENF